MIENKERILIVDDVPENIQLLHYALRNDGYLFSIATNATEAFSAIESELPDLILLDIMLPDIDGFEICTQLQKNRATANIPIIFLTAKVDKNDKIKGLQLGAVDYITKPFDEDEVLARVRAHLRLKKTEQMLRDTNSMKDRLFSIIGHDLRGPIGNFIAALESMVNDFNNYKKAEVYEMLCEMKNSAASTFYLLENLLHWARSQTGEIHYQNEYISVNELINENVALFSIAANLKKIKLYTDITQNFTVNADANTLNTVLRNLISNALKFTNKNGKICISAKKNTFAQLVKQNYAVKQAFAQKNISFKRYNQLEFIEIEIADTGVGINETVINKLFTLESKSRRGTADERGFGLGLVICKEFVEENNGAIWVKSEVGKGSSFFIILPVEAI